MQDLAGQVILRGLYAPQPFYGEYAPVGIGQQEYVLMDRQGNYDPEHVYSYLYFDSAAEMYQFDTLDNMHGYVDLSGNVIVRTQGSIYMCEDEYTGHTILEEKNYETSTYAVTDLDTGASMTRVISDGTMNYLGNGWVQWLSLIHISYGRFSRVLPGFPSRTEIRLFGGSAAIVFWPQPCLLV